MIRTEIRRHWVPGDAVSTRAAYAGLWSRFLLAPNDTERGAIAQLLDRIARGAPRAGWGHFASTLPGYIDFWNRIQEEEEDLCDRDRSCAC